MRAFVVTPPEPAITLQEAKDHLGIRHDDQDNLIADKVAAATAHIDGPGGWLGRAIGPQVLEARFDSFRVPDKLCLPYPPLIEVVSVKYLDRDRVEQLVDASDYELIDRTIYPIGATPWTGGYHGRETIRVRYRAGYAANPQSNPLIAAVPEPIKAAILFMVGDMMAFRETAVTGTISGRVQMTASAENLLRPYRVFM